MVFKRKRHIFSHGERIVERRVLKQKAHLLPDLAHPVEGQAGNILTVNAYRSGVGRFEADDQPQQHALSRAAASEHGQGLPTDQRAS